MVKDTLKEAEKQEAQEKSWELLQLCIRFLISANLCVHFQNS